MSTCRSGNGCLFHIIEANVAADVNIEYSFPDGYLDRPRDLLSLARSPPVGARPSERQTLNGLSYKHTVQCLRRVNQPLPMKVIRPVGRAPTGELLRIVPTILGHRNKQNS